MSRTIVKNFEDFEGLDLTSSDLSRGENFAQAMENWEHIGLKSIRGRRGFKKFAFHEKGGSATFDAQAHGIATYKYLEQNQTATNLKEDLILFYGPNAILFQATGSITMTYVGAATTRTFSILFDTTSNTHKATFKEDGVVTQTITLTATTLSSFVSTVNGYANWNCSIASPTGATFPTIGASTTEPLAIEAFPLIEDMSIATGGGTNIEFSYMKVRNALTAISNKFPSGATQNNYSFVNGYGQPLSWLNKNNVLYIATGRRLTKWDGMNLYDACLPPAVLTSLTNVAGAGLSAGTYKYRIRFHYKDYQQNDIYSDYVESSIVVAGGGVGTVTIAYGAGNIANGYNAKFGRINAGLGYTGVDLPVDAGHTFEVGDPIYFWGTVAFVPTAFERYVTATTATTISISGTNVTVGDNTPLSCNLRIQIGRTAANGVDFYLLPDEMTWDIAGNTFSEAYPDTTLASLELFETPELPLRDDNDATVMCVHQGKLFIVAGYSSYSTTPSTDIYYEFDDNFIECFSDLATVRVPSTTSSPITCLHSDNDSMLAVFKEDCYYNVVGDITIDGNYEVITKSEEDIGCPSPHSIKKINAIKGSLFCSNRGFALLSGGEIDESIGERTRIAFQDIGYYRGEGIPLETVVIKQANQSSIIPFKAVAINNNIDGKYICTVPAFSGTWGSQVTQVFERVFVFDYRYNKWSEWTFTDSENNGGMVIYKGKLHTLQVETAYAYPGTNSTCQIWKELRNEVSNLQSGSTYANSPKYDYIDGTSPIVNRLQTTGINLGDPSILKVYLACKIYQLQTAITAFSLNLQTVRNFDYSQAHSTVDYSFTTTTKEQSKDLKRSASRVLAFEFSNEEYHECPMMSGYEIEMDQDYAKEGVVRK